MDYLPKANESNANKRNWHQYFLQSPNPESFHLTDLTAMFGATILVPVLLGVDPAIALLMNGLGTLLYSWVTKGGIPAYLGSSFAFIAPSLLIISSYGKVSAAISTIPGPVLGGISLLLYGVIAVQGIRMLVEQKVDFSKNRNMVLGAVTFVIGVSGASIRLGSVQLKGMAFAAIAGVVLSLIFWILDRLGWMNEES